MDERFARLADQARHRDTQLRDAEEELARTYRERRDLVRKAVEPKVREVVKAAARGIRWAFSEIRIDPPPPREQTDGKGYRYIAQMTKPSCTPSKGLAVWTELSMTNERCPLQPYSIELACLRGEYYASHPKPEIPGGNSATLEDLPQKLEQALRVLLGL